MKDPETTVKIGEYTITVEYDDWCDFIRVEKDGETILFEPIDDVCRKLKGGE
jgi:hypothetical protein